MVRVRRQALMALISTGLGDEKAAQLIVSTAADLGLGTLDFSLEEARQVFAELTKLPGLVGVTAMLAKTRLARLFREDVAA